MTEFKNQILEGHNLAREAVALPPLVWEPILSKYARIFSDDIRRRGCKLIYTPRNSFGENVFKGIRITAKDAVAAWVAGKQWYNHDNNTCLPGKDCTDYTQVVWRHTIRVGCSQFKCESGETFITCEYYPPGNYKGARPY
ncbi:Allergen V5/Tpx-1-related [Macleaya cordata]|uniref:Allergen V5/Tpx-1-related n=1 Tax=Macleaya cordata TaxID=56857 RepID=A0A200QRH0_MACCD|nr:Allergen V5/Tpx-1-related [Macleaya cordata]